MSLLLRKGDLAKSTAGHDRNHIYVIVDHKEDTVWLANGTNKTVHQPKKKKLKHVQIIYNKKNDDNGLTMTDSVVKYIIDEYVCNH